MEKGCDSAPEHECLWAGARARAWFCGTHYEPWKKAQGDLLELAKERKVSGGQVGKAYGDKGKEAGMRLATGWGETVEEATQGQLKKAKTYQKLVMFDFDGTLFRSWEETPQWWDGSELDDGPFSFFVKPESLDEPCVPERPGSDYWIGGPLGEAKKAVRDRNSVSVIITGRIGIHKKRVKELLAQKGLRFDHYYFNPGMSAAAFKVAVLKNLLVGYNTISEVEIWENENEKTYDSAMRATANAVGREVEVEVHHVHSPAMELVCGPGDFGLSSQNTRMATSKTAAVTGDSTGVGFFIPLPQHLAEQYPSLEPQDDSPSHVTFMYVGDIKGREAEFEQAARVAFSTVSPGVRAALTGVDTFEGPDKKVVHSRVRFSDDLIQAHNRVKESLEAQGFEVAHSFPFLTPHVTIAYLDEGAEWSGHPPKGSWSFDSIQVWGLPKMVEIPFGEQVPSTPALPPEMGARKFARLMERRASAALLRKHWDSQE